MVATISQIIGKVNPDFYAENAKDLLEKYKDTDKIPAEEIKEKPISKHNFVYDSSSETLEPIYFFIIDLMDELGLNTEKLVDNFASSPGSGHFSELGQKATVMQQQATKTLGDVNTVLRSILNIIYDLKDFRMRLIQYGDLKNEKKKEAAILALKQVWMDKVDMQKGNSSIKAMSFQGGFQTLIHAFLFAKTLDDVNKMDLNEPILRILRARIIEFNDWLVNSEKELQKRYKLEKIYLKSQVNALKLYSRWAKPYLKTAQELEMKETGKEPAMVKAFNTILLELVLFGKKKIDKKDEEALGNLPKGFGKLKTREYYFCTLVEFKFRGIPQRISQQAHYVFGGRADISFKSYVLNEQELEKFDREIDSSDLQDVLRLIEGTTTESLEQLQEEINFFLEEELESPTNSIDVERPREEKKPSEDTSNPFIALIGGYEKKPTASASDTKPQKPEKEKTKITRENYAEKTYLKPLAEEKAKELAFKIFNTYKKAHGMPGF